VSWLLTQSGGGDSFPKRDSKVQAINAVGAGAKLPGQSSVAVRGVPECLPLLPICLWVRAMDPDARGVIPVATLAQEPGLEVRQGHSLFRAQRAVAIRGAGGVPSAAPFL